jgi:large subunit ribosomal protein L4
MPRLARRAALRAALTDKARSQQLVVVDAVTIGAPKTRALVTALTGLLGASAAPTLLVLQGPNTAVERAARNVPWLRVARPGQVSVAAVLGHRRLVIERDALLALQEALAP